MQDSRHTTNVLLGDNRPLEPRDELRGSLYQPRLATSRLQHMQGVIHGAPARAVCMEVSVGRAAFGGLSDYSAYSRNCRNKTPALCEH